jgi:hypothetical protein
MPPRIAEYRGIGLATASLAEHGARVGIIGRNETG